MISFESYNNPSKWSHFAAGETEAERLRQHYDVMGARPAENSEAAVWTLPQHLEHADGQV